MSTARTGGTRCTHAALALYDANTCHQPYLPYSFAHIQSSRCMTPTHTNARTRSTRVPHADLALHDADTYQTARTALMRYLSRVNISYLWYSFARIQASRCMLLTHAIISYLRYSFTLMHPSRCMTLTHSNGSYLRSYMLPRAVRCVHMTSARTSGTRSRSCSPHNA